MKKYKLYEPQNSGNARFVVWTFVILSALIMLGTCYWFTPFTDSGLKAPSPNNVNPKEVNLVTMEMDFATIYEALASERCTWASVNRPKGIFYHPIHLTPKADNPDAYSRYVPEHLAQATAKRYPHLFKYDSEQKEFTLIVTDPKKQFIVMPAWLVANMIDSRTLLLP